MTVMRQTISSFEDRSSDDYRGRAPIRGFCENIPDMDDSFRERLSGAIERAGKSARRVSLDAGLGPGYVHSIIKERKDPTIDKLIAICDAIPISLMYVVYGVDASPHDIEILRALRDHPAARDGILAILRATGDGST